MILILFAITGCVVYASGADVPVVQLSDGRYIPSIGLGTWLGFKPGEIQTQEQLDTVEVAAAWAFDAGYRHIDTASYYETEPQIGRAIKKKIKEGVVKREDLFITTKLWNDRHARDQVIPALKESLARLDLDYVDLYMMHFPIGVGDFVNGTLDNTDYLDTWLAMVEARDQGLAKSIGVCNYNIHQLTRLIALSGIKPAALQIEVNLNIQQPELLDYCRQLGIPVVGYTPFGSLFYEKATEDAPPPRVDDERLVAIAHKYNKTVPQINLRYLIGLGAIPIPKSVQKAHIEENIDVFDFELTFEERELLKSFDRHYRTITVSYWADSPNYPFEQPIH